MGWSCCYCNTCMILFDLCRYNYVRRNERHTRRDNVIHRKMHFECLLIFNFQAYFPPLYVCEFIFLLCGISCDIIRFVSLCNEETILIWFQFRAFETTSLFSDFWFFFCWWSDNNVDRFKQKTQKSAFRNFCRNLSISLFPRVLIVYALFISCSPTG